MKSKRWQFIVVGIGAGLATILSIALLFVEFRLLLSGDAALYENSGVQGVKIVGRILCFFIVWLHAIVGVIGLFKKGSFTTFVLMVGFSAMLVSVLSFIFYEWYFGAALCAANLLILSSPTLRLIRQRFFFEEKEAEE